MIDDSLLAQASRLLRRFNLKARKSLGQHFLVDNEALNLIISAAELTPDDTVVEVGPGLGVLTGKLAERAGSVIAVELDDNLAELLKQTITAGNVNIVNRNILDIDPASLLPAGGPYKVVANLPYYITSPVLRHFLEAAVKPQVMIVMLQQEVAEAIAAGAGQRSLLSIGIQFYGNPQIIGLIPAASFYPAPKVDSAILKIDVYIRPPVDVSDEKGFFGLVRAGFTAARKQVANSLARGLGIPKADALSLLDKAGIDPKRRAETFSLEEWARLFKVFQAGEGK
ncbi:16S rRNA (adenine(1518)-N(6)/adenine(1519)-N(6))-dimethyltransferase RsmA [Chloroflexota bacterium]